MRVQDAVRRLERSWMEEQKRLLDAGLISREEARGLALGADTA